MLSPSARYEDSTRLKVESSLDENFVLDEDLTARVIKVEEVDQNVVIDDTTSNQGGDASNPKKMASNI
jgi:hypothetical protein